MRLSPTWATAASGSAAAAAPGCVSAPQLQEPPVPAVVGAAAVSQLPVASRAVCGRT